ncbi:MAG: amidohydrolase, partial [candidate division Zixibacteria bacterium]|nr:amidohydrolase [candidate division Zixibacteria bacterium]
MLTKRASSVFRFTSVYELFLAAVVCLCSIAVAADSFAQTTPEYGIRDKTPNKVLLVNARIVVSPRQSFDSGSLYIVDGRVAAVGSDIQDTAGATVIDLRGRTIYPGFIDAFTDYGLPTKKKAKKKSKASPEYTRDRVGGSAWNAAIHAENNCVDEFRPDDKAAKELREQGFTAVLSTKHDGILRGRSFVASLGEGLPNDLILRPHHWHGASFDKGNSQQGSL